MKTKSFHNDNGMWSFRVKYNEEAKMTYITRYKSNGHLNAIDSKKTFFDLIEFNSIEDVESVFYTDKFGLSRSEVDQLPEPAGKFYRKQQLIKFNEIDKEMTGGKFASRFEEAIKNCDLS